MNSARWIHPDYDLAEQWQDEHEREEAAPVPPLEDDPYPGYLGATGLRTEWQIHQARREAEYEPPRPLDEPSPPPVGTLRRRGRSQQPASSAP